MKSEDNSEDDQSQSFSSSDDNDSKDDKKKKNIPGQSEENKLNQINKKKAKKNEAYVDFDIMKGIQTQHESSSKQPNEPNEEVQVQSTSCIRKFRDFVYGQGK